MRKHMFTSITTAIFLVLLLAVFARAQEEPKTVTDYLLSLPANFYQYIEPGYTKYRENKPKTKAQIEEYRRSRIVLEDIKNGFIKYKEDPNINDWVEIALFKKNSGGYLMAINRGLQYKGCDGKLNFVEYNSGTWTDVTKKYALPLSKSEMKKSKDSIFCYELPQQGRRIRLYTKWYDEPEDTFGYFEWNGENFINEP